MIRYGLKAYVEVPLYANLYDVRTGWAVIEETVLTLQRMITVYQPQSGARRGPIAGTTWLTI